MFANRPDKSNEIGTTAGGPSKAIPHPGRNRAARPFATILIPEIPDHLDIANIPLMLPQRQNSITRPSVWDSRARHPTA
jgi:hypothetical protein